MSKLFYFIILAAYLGDVTSLTCTRCNNYDASQKYNVTDDGTGTKLEALTSLYGYDFLTTPLCPTGLGDWTMDDPRYTRECDGGACTKNHDFAGGVRYQCMAAGCEDGDHYDDTTLWQDSTYCCKEDNCNYLPGNKCFRCNSYNTSAVFGSGGILEATEMEQQLVYIHGLQVLTSDFQTTFQGDFLTTPKCLDDFSAMANDPTYTIYCPSEVCMASFDVNGETTRQCISESTVDVADGMRVKHVQAPDIITGEKHSDDYFCHGHLCNKNAANTNSVNIVLGITNAFVMLVLVF